jgi:uracil-DNA glycosylase family 4
MTTILKEMGIQQWRLRQPHTSVVAMLDIDRTVDSENSARPVTAPPEITSPTADAISRDFETSSNVGAGDITGDLASDAALAETSRKSDLKSSIKPMPAPASESVSVKIPMPTPVLAPIAMPSEAAASFDPTAAPIDPTAAPIVATAAPIDPEPNRVAERPILNPMAELDWHGLQGLIDDQNQCQSCGSANSILGSGDPKADWLFVTDAPTSMDLESQQMFSGRAGQLYEAMLLAVGHNRDSVYTTSVFKCATSDTISVIPSCEKLLQRQIELIQPKVVIAFGEFAAQSVVKSNEGLESLRAQELRCYQTKVRVVVSYSPWQLLDQPSLKAGAWSDLKKCLAITH